MSLIAKTASVISATTLNTDQSLEGKLISTTGLITSNETIGDDLFLNPDIFIALERRVEMYAWTEKTTSQSSVNTGGSETTQKTYTYTKSWEQKPKASIDFKHPEGHENPQKNLSDENASATNAQIGEYRFAPQQATLPEFSQLELNPQNVTVNDGAILTNSNFIFIKKSVDGTFETPQIGDLRVSYYVLKPGFEGTLFGKLSQREIVSYTNKDNITLYHLFLGTREDGIAKLHSDYTSLLWILRFLGFMLMWIGLTLLFGPISVLLDFLPFLGTMSRFVVGTAMFILAFVVSILTIIISMILHSLIAVIISVIIIAGVATFFVMKKKNNMASTTAPMTPANPPLAPINPQLENYIKEAKIRGMTSEQIKQALLTAGWASEDVNRALM